jgi:hypothetical protein
MQKWMCLGAIGVAGLALLLCALDLFTGIPFRGSSDAYILADIGALIAAAVLGYLGWNAYQDVK